MIGCVGVVPGKNVGRWVDGRMDEDAEDEEREDGEAANSSRKSVDCASK